MNERSSSTFENVRSTSNVKRRKKEKFYQPSEHHLLHQRLLLLPDIELAKHTLGFGNPFETLRLAAIAPNAWKGDSSRSLIVLQTRGEGERERHKPAKREEKNAMLTSFQ